MSFINAFFTLYQSMTHNNKTVGKNEIKCTCFNKCRSNLTNKLSTDYDAVNIYGQTITAIASCPNKLLLKMYIIN